MLRAKLKRGYSYPFDKEEWKPNVRYVAKILEDGRIELCYPGSPMKMITTIDQVILDK